MKTIKELRSLTNLSQQKFGDIFHIPAANISLWEQGRSTPPPYVNFMIEEIMRSRGMIKENQNGDANS